jgi:uncharacterized protein YcbK (DUF882 family)
MTNQTFADREEAFDAAAGIHFGAAKPLGRRTFLRGLAGVAALAAPSGASAAVSQLMCSPYLGGGGGSSGGAGLSNGPLEKIDYTGLKPLDAAQDRRLTMVNAHTGEHFDETYVSGGSYVQSAVDAFARFARDFRRNEVMPIDPRSMDIVWQVWKKIGVGSPMTLLSGYRSPTTNASLPGTAKQSLHMRGKALDITHSGSSVRAIYAAAMSLRGGGVGKYTANNFVHIDSGRVRTWGS